MIVILSLCLRVIVIFDVIARKGLTDAVCLIVHEVNQWPSVDADAVGVC